MASDQRDSTPTYETYRPSDTSAARAVHAACGSCPACGLCGDCDLGRPCHECACRTETASTSAWQPAGGTHRWGSGSTTRSSLSSPRRSRSSGTSAGKRAAAGGASGLALCGGGIAANHSTDEPTRQERYDQCVTQFLNEHPREVDPYLGPGYAGTLMTPESTCEYVLD